MGRSFTSLPAAARSLCASVRPGAGLSDSFTVRQASRLGSNGAKRCAGNAFFGGVARLRIVGEKLEHVVALQIPEVREALAVRLGRSAFLSPATIHIPTTNLPRDSTAPSPTRNTEAS
jgi:hypothetical protein